MVNVKGLSVEKIEKVAEILKAIAHPVRLQILDVLREHNSLSVSEIQQAITIQTEQSLLSHHLIKMKDKGVLVCEKRGMNVFYALADRHLLSIFDCMERCDLF
jgi:ArsR family transcriptional regulator